VTNVARILTGNARDAEDVCQETFVRALGALSRFRGEAAFSSWLYRIAINQARNLLAREQVRQRLQVVEPTDDGGASPSQRPVVELRIALLRAMARLSEGQREVVICHDVLGMKHEEIAYVLGCAAGTSKAQLHRARLQLRALLGGNGSKVTAKSGDGNGNNNDNGERREHERM
jgi:RNA polymerase sigma-70 factor (ECF subfamily)